MAIRFFIFLGLAIIAILLFSRLKDWLSRRHDSTPGTGDSSGPIIDAEVVTPSPKVSDDSKGQDSHDHSGAHGGPSSDSGGSDGGGGDGGGGD